ncbi:MAG: DUF99 family protein [Candidatus Woesearchaeota archaeon]
MKKEIRVLGIDDSPFEKKSKQNVLVIGTVFRGGVFMDGLLSCWIKKDGVNATKRITEMINKSKFKTQIRCIFLKGIAVGGFNVINIFELSKKTNIPVIVVIRNYPDYNKIFSALKKIGKKKEIELISSFPKPKRINSIYIQHINISLRDALSVLNITTKHSDIPEPLRIAHIIASGIIKGESRGRA